MNITWWLILVTTVNVAAMWVGISAARTARKSASNAVLHVNSMVADFEAAFIIGLPLDKRAEYMSWRKTLRG